MKNSVNNVSKITDGIAILLACIEWKISVICGLGRKKVINYKVNPVT
jgi:hypothetical protein